MSWIQDTLTAAKNQFVERAGNPFVIGFVVAWVCLNFETVLTVIGKGGFHEKILFLRTLPYETDRTLYLPLLAAALWPISDLLLSAGAKQIANWKQSLNLLIDRKTPIDSQRQKEFFSALEADLHARQGKIDELQKELNEINGKFTASHKALSERLQRAQLDLQLRLPPGARLSDLQVAQSDVEKKINDVIANGDLRRFLEPNFNNVLRAIKASQEEEADVTEVWLSQAAKIPYKNAKATLNSLIGLGLVEENVLLGETKRRFARTAVAWAYFEKAATETEVEPAAVESPSVAIKRSREDVEGADQQAASTNHIDHPP